MSGDHAALARALGTRMRASRHLAGLTLVQLAERTNLSQPFLSQAENGHTTPSLINLHRIAQALGTTAHVLLEEQSSPVPTAVIAAADRREYELPHGGVLRFCAPGNRAMDLNEVTAEPGASAEDATSHPGEELVHVLTGGITFVVGQEVHVLSQGDTIYYAAIKPHRWFNEGDSLARFLIASTPPGF